LVGYDTSIALDSNDYPHISYYDSTNGDLKYARSTGSTWITETVDASGIVGKYTSMVLDRDDYPHISYYDETNGNLKYARGEGSAWNIRTVDSPGNVGRYTSISLDRNEYPHISYYDYDDGNLKYARWTSSSWSKQTVESSGDVGLRTSLALDRNGFPHISYRDNTNYDLKYAKAYKPADDVLGSFPGSGVWYWNSMTEIWDKMSTPAQLVAAGDVDGDYEDDLIGVWSSGLWLSLSTTMAWTRVSSYPPTDIACGDMNGDGRDDVLGSWADLGVWYAIWESGKWDWVKMSTAADLIAAGDLDADLKDDLVGVWSSGLWVKFSYSGNWVRISSTHPTDIACGDITGTGWDEVIGNWAGSGIWYGILWFGIWDWVWMSTPADLIAAGDVDGDRVDDLVGVWSNGLWVLFSSSMSWMRITPVIPNHIDTGLFRTGTWDTGTTGYVEPVGGFAEGPESLTEYQDFSDEGPGGMNFVFHKERNLIPLETDSQILKRTPGPVEPEFIYREQKNRIPKEEPGGRRKKEK
jgi:hypothetical protein